MIFHINILCRFKTGKRVESMGRKWNNIKDKKHQKMQILAVYTRNLDVKFM